MIPPRLLLLLLLLLLPPAFFLALTVGSVETSWDNLLVLFRPDTQGFGEEIILRLRLPRAVAAFATGGMLALAGALMQVLLKNPLADPFVLGVSGGAATLALLTLFLGLPVWTTAPAACVGAMISIFLVFLLAGGGQRLHPDRLLLTGIVVASGWGAVVNLLLAMGEDVKLKGMIFWLLGDLGQTTFPHAALLTLLVGFLTIFPMARPLNLLSRGEDQAAALGVNVPPLLFQIYLTASLLTAMAVTTAGSIGFVGLVAPHLVRLAGGADHRILLPASTLLGGLLLLLADTGARTLLAPRQLPVGVVTALVGVPLFLLLLKREKT